MRKLIIALAACGSAGPPAKPPPAAPPPAPPPAAVTDDHAKREELTAAHRKLEEEQQDALGARCDDPKPQDAHPRCLPSCYATEAPDPRAGKKLAGAVEIAHLACGSSETGPFVVADELDGTLAVRAVRGRAPKPHGKGSWQQAVEHALAEAQHVAKGDTIVVTGTWREHVHPLTKERLRCVTFSHIARAMHRPLDACGGDGALACEATGDAAARGINVVHYRLAEARRLQAAGHQTECQQAALEAIAVARGLPRWRQYAKLNVGGWVEHAGYRTRFDGTLDEDALFQAAATLGGEAEGVYAACGGPASAPTTPAQEQSFHTCW